MYMTVVFADLADEEVSLILSFLPCISLPNVASCDHRLLALCNERFRAFSSGAFISAVPTIVNFRTMLDCFPLSLQRDACTPCVACASPSSNDAAALVSSIRLWSCGNAESKSMTLPGHAEHHSVCHMAVWEGMLALAYHRALSVYDISGAIDDVSNQDAPQLVFSVPNVFNGEDSHSFHGSASVTSMVWARAAGSLTVEGCGSSSGGSGSGSGSGSGGSSVPPGLLIVGYEGLAWLGTPPQGMAEERELEYLEWFDLSDISSVWEHKDAETMDILREPCECMLASAGEWVVLALYQNALLSFRGYDQVHLVLVRVTHPDAHNPSLDKKRLQQFINSMRWCDQMDSGDHVFPVCSLTGHRGLLMNVTVDETGRVAATGSDGMVRVWDEPGRFTPGYACHGMSPGMTGPWPHNPYSRLRTFEPSFVMETLYTTPKLASPILWGDVLFCTDTASANWERAPIAVWDLKGKRQIARLAVPTAKVVDSGHPDGDCERHVYLVHGLTAGGGALVLSTLDQQRVGPRSSTLALGIPHGHVGGLRAWTLDPLLFPK